MIKFITEEQASKEPTFGDVENGQFFVADGGCLFQKEGTISASLVADGDGRPCAVGIYEFSCSSSVERILPHVTKIEF